MENIVTLNTLEELENKLGAEKVDALIRESIEYCTDGKGYIKIELTYEEREELEEDAADDYLNECYEEKLDEIRERFIDLANVELEKIEEEPLYIVSPKLFWFKKILRERYGLYRN